MSETTMTVQQALDFAKAQARAYENGYKAGMANAAKVCEGEYLTDPPETSEDTAYNTGVYDCISAILKARGGE